LAKRDNRVAILCACEAHLRLVWHGAILPQQMECDK
jgi:hypothetical protein